MEHLDYRKILDQLPDPTYVTNTTGIEPIFFNQAWYAFTGLTPEEALLAWQRIVDPHDAERVAAVISNAVAKQEQYEVEVRLRKADDTYVWCLSRGCPIKDEDGKVIAYVGTTLDISGRKLGIQQVEQIYEQEVSKRQERIKQLEEELKIHQSQI